MRAVCNSKTGPLSLLDGVPLSWYTGSYALHYSAFYWPWVVYPVGKCILILKGGASGSAVLAAAVKGFIML